MFLHKKVKEDGTKFFVVPKPSPKWSVSQRYLFLHEDAISVDDTTIKLRTENGEIIYNILEHPRPDKPNYLLEFGGEG